MFSSLAQRRRQPEIMDQPGLAADQHHQALRGLARINRWSHSAGLIWSALRPMIEAPASPGRPLRVLDVATGGGDVPIALGRRARRAGRAIEILGCDRSATAVEYARRQARDAGVDATFFVADVVNADAGAGELARLAGNCDVVTCSLFLHHLDQEQAVELLDRLRRLAARAVIVNDLRRCPLGMAAAYLGTRLLSASPVVRVDGPRSVAAAFTRDELAELARRAGMQGAEIAPRWPFRLLLRWEKP